MVKSASEHIILTCAKTNIIKSTSQAPPIGGIARQADALANAER
jgi:hypothetical protein